MQQLRGKRGNATLEFTLVGLPLIFVLISVASMCFGMFTLHTMQEAVEQGSRYVVTHGGTCSAGSNTCSITVGNIVDTITSAAPGILRSSLNVTLIPNSGTANQTTCYPISSCYGNSTVWPPSSNSDNSPGNDIVIKASFSYPTAIAMFWPGTKSSAFGTLTFHAISRQRIMF